jgi:hypothetical protein
MRVEHNELGLDEVVMHKCHFHLERMTDDAFWISVDNEHDGLYHINVYIENGKLKARIEQA